MTARVVPFYIASDRHRLGNPSNIILRGEKYEIKLS